MEQVKGLNSFREVGTALKKISDAKLYKKNHNTFEEYFRKKWGLSKTQGNRLIAAEDLGENLTPIGVILHANESQARPLTKLKPEQQHKAWQRVLDSAPETKYRRKFITAKAVSRVVDEVEIRSCASKSVDDSSPTVKIVIQDAAPRMDSNITPTTFHGPIFLLRVQTYKNFYGTI